MCYECKKRLVCPNCSIGLVFHQTSKKAICHYCDYKKSLNQKCTNNKDCEFTFYGLGIERVFEEVQLIFPETKIQIFSSDSINNNKNSEQIINDIEKNKIQFW